MSIPVYSVVAWSGTGKTTILEQIIPVLKDHGLRVAVVKHDAHDFQVDEPGKDSYRMTQAGADLSVVTNDHHAAFMDSRPRSMEDIVASIRDVDVILTEGYKEGPWTKIGVMREATGKGLPPAPEGYLFVMADCKAEVSAPVIGLTDVVGAAQRILEDMAARRG